MKLPDHQPTLRGERVILRPPQESDKHDRLTLGRDPEFRRMVGGDPHTLPPLTETEVERWYDEVDADPLHWVIEYEGRCIGAARLHAMDTQNRRARYAIGIFDPVCWGKRLGREATDLVLAYGFRTLTLHRIDLRVLSFNARAIACYEKCGFVREGTEREGSLIGREWHSDVLMSILEHEYAARVRRGAP